MPEWLVWVIVGLAAWILVALVLAHAVGRAFALGKGPPHWDAAPHPALPLPPPAGGARLQPRRILAVGDDPALRLLAGEVGGAADTLKQRREEQLLVYAHDLGRLVQVERAQRRLLQQAYRQTVQVLVDALEAKDQTTRLHSQRVTRYALELTGHIEPSLLDDPSLEFGFLLHDIGKIGVPEAILNKPGPLEARERREMQQHPLIGAGILAEVALLAGHGIEIVRSHHERWDGRGYPHRLANEQIPLGARIFALADALDSMTHDRPYRSRMSWQQATDEILAQDGRQFDPRVVRAFIACQADLRRISVALDPAALSAC